MRAGSHIAGLGVRRLLVRAIVAVLGAAVTAQADEPAQAGVQLLPSALDCVAAQTAGFHDYPHNQEAYEAVVFVESKFSLSVNHALMKHLAPTTLFDFYMTFRDAEQVVDLQCRIVRGAGSSRGISCSNVPPSELLLLNADNLRFTRTSIGGWTFTGATTSADGVDGQSTDTAGESIFVEYGQCAAVR